MNERILIIEDDQQILKLLQRGLAYEGYTVDTATDGRMGLILARDHTPDPGHGKVRRHACRRLFQSGELPVYWNSSSDAPSPSGDYDNILRSSSC